MWQHFYILNWTLAPRFQHLKERIYKIKCVFWYWMPTIWIGVLYFTVQKRGRHNLPRQLGGHWMCKAQCKDRITTMMMMMMALRIHHACQFAAVNQPLNQGGLRLSFGTLSCCMVYYCRVRHSETMSVKGGGKGVEKRRRWHINRLLRTKLGDNTLHTSAYHSRFIKFP